MEAAPPSCLSPPWLAALHRALEIQSLSKSHLPSYNHWLPCVWQSVILEVIFKSVTSVSSGQRGRVSGTPYKALVQPHCAAERRPLRNPILSLVSTILITNVWVFSPHIQFLTPAGYPTVQLNSDTTQRKYQIPQVKSSVPPDCSPSPPPHHLGCQSQGQVIVILTIEIDRDQRF